MVGYRPEYIKNYYSGGPTLISLFDMKGVANLGVSGGRVSRLGELGLGINCFPGALMIDPETLQLLSAELQG